jgi:hypothetical protein
MLKPDQSILKNAKGQSIFELIVFVPLLLIVLTMMVTTGNAINSSINQLKATRGYFYFILRGNPTGQRKTFLQSYVNQYSLQTIGMNVVGWRTRRNNDEGETLATCYRYNAFLSNLGNDTNCDEPASLTEAKTPFIRIYTAYGICSETYQIAGDPNKIYVPHNLSGRSEGCHLR